MNEKVCSKCDKPCKPETYRINVCSDPLVVSNCCKAAFTDSEKDDIVSRVTLFSRGTK